MSCKNNIRINLWQELTFADDPLPKHFEEQPLTLKFTTKPPNIHQDPGMSCIDLIITDKPNLFVESGVQSSLDNRFQHQIIYGKLNISVPSPPPYKRTLWDYSKADSQSIRKMINELDWHTRFNGLGPEEMTKVFTNNLYSIFSSNIPNKEVACNDKDPPWITPQLKKSIKRKQRTYRNFILRGRREEDWERVKNVRNSSQNLLSRPRKTIFKVR